MKVRSYSISVGNQCTLAAAVPDQMNFVTPSFDAGPDPAKAMKVRHIEGPQHSILLVNGEPPEVILNRGCPEFAMNHKLINRWPFSMNRNSIRGP